MIKRRNIAVAIILSILTCGLYAFYWIVTITDDTAALSGEEMTKGSVALILTIITCGLYGFYWTYKITKRLDKVKHDRNYTVKNQLAVREIFFALGVIITLALLQKEINSLSDKF